MPKSIFIILLLLGTVLWGGASMANVEQACSLLPNEASESATFTPRAAIGERLVYEAKWGPFKVATGVVTVEGPVEIDGVPCIRFSMDVRTNSFADAIFKVRDTFTGYATADLGRSIRYEQRELHHDESAEIDVSFDHETGQVRMIRDGEEGEPLEMAPGSLDPISAIFAARLQEYVADSEFSVAVADGKRSGNLPVKVRGSEEISTKAGKFNALLMEPDLTDFHSHFKENKKAYIQLWVADDEARTPVMMIAKVKWAKIKIKLEEYERPG